MNLRVVACALLLTVAPLAHASRFLAGYDEAPTLAKAFELVNAQPERHVLLHFDMSQRLADAELRKAMADRLMHKENQEWFLDLPLDKDNTLQAIGRRKDGLANMRGTGKWYVTKKGKLCLELTTGGVDENWCRHVSKVGEGYYLSTALRPKSPVYRFALADC